MALLDIAATLLGQPEAYWAGDRSASFDANPLVRMALGFSPWLAVPAAVAWCGFIAISMLTLPRLWRGRLYVFLCVAHFVFVSGWALRWSPATGILILPVAAVIAPWMRRQLREAGT